MKRHTLTIRLTRTGAAALTCLALAGNATPSHAGWNPFAPGSPIDVGPKSGQIAIADFNGDGHADLLVSHPLHGRATLLPGDGRGEFPLAGRTAVKFDYDPAALAVGDVNGDNQPDLAVASRDGSTARLHILLNANGRFQEIKESSFPAGQIGDNGWKPTLKLADVNGDEKLDLVSANGRQRTVNVFYGSGAGQFSPGQTIALDEGFDRYTHIVDDFNGDGRLDLVAAAAITSDHEPGQLSVLLGNAEGVLLLASELSTTIPAGSQVKTLGDVDGDERPDIVLTHGKSMSVVTQGKDGKLALTAGSPFDLGHEAFAVAAVPAGFTGNDVLVAATIDSLDVVYADQGAFRRACESPIPAGPGAYNVAAGDLNGDGMADIVANSFEGEALSLLLSN